MKILGEPQSLGAIEIAAHVPRHWLTIAVATS
jgi:hypothetical protein